MLVSLLLLLSILATGNGVLGNEGIGIEVPEIEGSADPDPFQKIAFKAPGSSRPTPKSSLIQRRSLPNFEIIYSIASNFDSDLNFDNVASAWSIIKTFGELLLDHPYIMMAAFIYQRDTQEGVLLKTPEHRGPLFLVLGLTDNGNLEPIPEVVQLVNNCYEMLKMATFQVQPSQLFLAFPANFNEAWENMLFLDSSGWFIELPLGAEEVSNVFELQLAYKKPNINTEMAFARLGDVQKATFIRANPWEQECDDKETDGLMMTLCNYSNCCLS
jgi:hypothetical protein